MGGRRLSGARRGVVAIAVAAGVAVALAVAGAVPAVGALAAQGAAAATAREEPALLGGVRLEARARPESLTVGDRVVLELSVEVPAGLRVTFPSPAISGGQVEVRGFQVQEPAAGRQADAGSGRARWVGRYTLAVFGLGRLVLPPWPVQVSRESLYAVAHTDSLALFVSSVLTDSLAASADPRDLKPQADLPVSPWPWILLALGVAAVAAGLWWWLRRRRRPRGDVVPLAPPRPAHEVALAALRRLETRRLPVDGKYEEHHVLLSEILRRYLEDGFGVAALEETTEEILFDLGRQGFEPVLVRQVGGLCAESDLVKFARHEPTVEECGRALEHVRDFVLKTAAQSLAPAGAPAAAAAGDSAPASVPPPPQVVGRPGA